MSESTQDRKEPSRRIAQIIRDAGGQIVGRTKLQKTAYLLFLAKFESTFQFGYKYYGPYSEALASAADLAAAFDIIIEDKKQASWGGTYSVYQKSEGQESADRIRVALTQTAANSDAVLLELAATAAYLATEGRPRPWAETARRKPDKAADDRLTRSKGLYRELRAISDNRLPDIGEE
jgi:uncharacterized protein YwgA